MDRVTGTETHPSPWQENGRVSKADDSSGGDLGAAPSASFYGDKRLQKEVVSQALNAGHVQQ